MIIQGDCLEVMRSMDDNSISAIVTDPPYGLHFMGKDWDYATPGKEYWEECLRISKPGSFLIAMGGTRTFHRLTCSIEDAGYEIRDCLSYLYGSGFPKSHNFGCKCTGDAVSYSHEKAKSPSQPCMRSLQETNLQTSVNPADKQGEILFSELQEQSLQSDRAMSFQGNETRKESCMEGGDNLQEKQGELSRPEICEMSPGIFRDGEERWVCDGTPFGDGKISQQNSSAQGSCTSQRSQSQKQQYRKFRTISRQQDSQNSGMATCEKCGGLKDYKGYGTALKPAWEPIVMAMKPCVGTFKQNAEKWGQAGLNIDGCRIGNESRFNSGAKNSDPKLWRMNQGINGKECIGRWPANLILDEESAKVLGDPSRFFYCAKASSSERNEGLEGLPITQTMGGGGLNNTEDNVCGKYGSIKASSRNSHPTVKPLKLMEYLIELVMPPAGGILLDPFAGSGTTILAAKRLGFEAIGIEKDAEYCKIAKARIDNFKEKDIIKENQQFELFAQVG